MDLTYAKEYEDFREEIAAFLQDNKDKAPGASPETSNREGRATWQKLLISGGLTARTIPKDYGGYGAEPDILKSRIIADEIRNSGLPGPMGGQGISMFVPTLLEMGNEEQKQKYIRPTLEGEMIWCQGYSEPGSGSDLASLQTKAELDGDDWVINGQKIWTSTAAQADMMFILTRTEPDAKKHAGISYLILDMTTPGIEVRPLMTMTGDASFNEVFFTDVRTPATNIVGKRGEGWSVANATLKYERGMLGDPDQAGSLIKRVADLMNTEQVDGEKLMDNPILRDRLMKLHGRALATRYHGMRLLTHQLNQENPGVAGMIVKLTGTILNHEINELAIDCLGELGVLYDGSKYLRAGGGWQGGFMMALGLIIGGGTSQIQKNIISERGLGMPREPKVIEQTW